MPELPEDNEPLDVSVYDEERLRGVLELGYAKHPDPERIQRLQATGNYRTYVRILEGDQLEAYLAPIAPGLEAEPEEVSIIKFDRAVLGQPPQG